MWFVFTDELGFAMVNIIFALSQFKIDDVDGIHLADSFIWFAKTNIFRYRFRNSIEHAMEIGLLSTVLYFNDAQLFVFAFCQNIYSVIFIVLVFLVAFAFQKAVNLKFLSK